MKYSVEILDARISGDSIEELLLQLDEIAANSNPYKVEYIVS